MCGTRTTRTTRCGFSGQSPPLGERGRRTARSSSPHHGGEEAAPFFLQLTCSPQNVKKIRLGGAKQDSNPCLVSVAFSPRFSARFRATLTRENSTGLKHAGTQSLQKQPGALPDAEALRSRMGPYLPTDSFGGQNNRACGSRATRAIVGTLGGRRWTLGPRCDRSDTVSLSARRPHPSFAKPPRPSRRSRSSS